MSKRSVEPSTPSEGTAPGASGKSTRAATAHDSIQPQPAPDGAAAGADGYEVTTSATTEDTRAGCALIAELESYVRSYVTLAEASYALVIALWLVATHAWIDALPADDHPSQETRSALAPRLLGAAHVPTIERANGRKDASLRTEELPC